MAGKPTNVIRRIVLWCFVNGYVQYTDLRLCETRKSRVSQNRYRKHVWEVTAQGIWWGTMYPVLHTMLVLFGFLFVDYLYIQQNSSRYHYTTIINRRGSWLNNARIYPFNSSSMTRYPAIHQIHQGPCYITPRFKWAEGYPDDEPYNLNANRRALNRL